MPPDSPRLRLVSAKALLLMQGRRAIRCDRCRSCGGVAKGSDRTESDIDFYIANLRSGEDAHRRALAIEGEFAAILTPYKVEVLGPHMTHRVSDDYERYREGAIELSTLIAEP